MHRGYTKRWRKRWDKGYHQDFLLWALMDYFIDFANWKENEFPFLWKGKLVDMVKLKRGQCFFTFKSLAEFFEGPKNKVSRKMVRERIKILEKIGFLEHEQGHQYQIVTVLNYDKYNPIEDNEGHKPAHQSTTNGPQMGHQSTTPNKDNNYKKDKEIKIALPEWLDESVWAEYKKYRSNGKNKLTPYAEKRAIIKLEKLRQEGNDPTEVIHESMICGWSGLFPLNRNKNNNQEQETPEQWLERQRKRRS